MKTSRARVLSLLLGSMLAACSGSVPGMGPSGQSVVVVSPERIESFESEPAPGPLAVEPPSLGETQMAPAEIAPALDAPTLPVEAVAVSSAPQVAPFEAPGSPAATAMAVPVSEVPLPPSAPRPASAPASLAAPVTYSQPAVAEPPGTGSGDPRDRQLAILTDAVMALRAEIGRSYTHSEKLLQETRKLRVQLRSMQRELEQGREENNRLRSQVKTLERRLREVQP